MSASASPTPPELDRLLVICTFLEHTIYDEVFKDETPDHRETLTEIERELAAAARLAHGIPPPLLQRLVNILPATSIEQAPRCAANACLMLINGLVGAGNMRDALGIAKLAVEAATIANDASLLRRALNACTGLANECGDHAAAIGFGSKAVSIARQLRDPLGELACWGNLCAALYQQGLYLETINMGRTAIGLESRADWPASQRQLFEELRGQVFINVSLSAARLGQWQLAAISVKHALERCNERTTLAVQNKLVALASATRVALALRDATGSRAHIAEVQQLHDRNPEHARIKINLVLLKAEYLLADEQPYQAKELLKGIEPLSQSIPPLHIDVLKALVNAHRNCGETSEAMDLMSRMVTHLTEARMEQISGAMHSVNAPVATKLPGRIDAHNFLERIARRSANTYRGSYDRAVQTAQQQAAFERFAVAAELREDATGFHAYRVGRLARLLAEEMELGSIYCDEIERAGRLHDIGKLAMPDSLLTKPGKYTEADWEIMHQHCAKGVHFLRSGEPEYFKVAREVALSHHENWDGSGYPERRSGTQIPLSARIVAFADTYDALTHARCYKPAWSHQDAVAELERLNGIKFDPQITPLFLKLVNRLTHVQGERLGEWLCSTASPSDELSQRLQLAKDLTQSVGHATAER